MEPKFCITCQHYRPGAASDCVAPENRELSMVTGEIIFPRWSAQTMRQFELTGCTVAGKWWKAKTQQETT